MFAAILVGGIAAVLGAQLITSIHIAEGAYTLQKLQARQAQLQREQQVMTERLDVLAAPQHLAAVATASGMVPSVLPAYLRLGDGAVLGTPSQATPGSGGLSAQVPNALLAH